MANKSEGSGVSKEVIDKLMSVMKGIEDQMWSMKRELSDEREAVDNFL